MKVLHVLYSKIYTGAEKVAAQIIKAFEGRVDMAYCSLECEEVWEILDGMGIRHYGVEELTPATLSRVIREYRPDVIHAHDMRTSFVAALCCGKIPLISHIHNNAYDARGLSAKSIAYLLAGFRAKHIFWVSNSSYEGYVFHRLFAKKSSVLYNIIDAKRIFTMRDSDENTYDFDMIYLGRLTYQKDPQRLMRLSAALKARKPDIKVAVVGAGELEEETKALCRELDLQDQQKTLYKTIESLWLDANSAQQQYVAAAEKLRSTQTSYDLIQEQFNLGMKNTVELLTEKNNLLNAQQETLQAKYMAILNAQLLRFYQGEGIQL